LGGLKEKGFKRPWFLVGKANFKELGWPKLEGPFNFRINQIKRPSHSKERSQKGNPGLN